MEIILKKDVENLGLEFDTVSVKPGYARNFLIPQGLAVLATPKNRAELAATLEARKEEKAKLIAAAKSIVEQLKKTTVSIAAKVGSEDRLFGSINNINLAEALANAGVNVDKNISESLVTLSREYRRGSLFGERKHVFKAFSAFKRAEFIKR